MKENNKGFTLIELLVSLAILSIFMVTVTFFVTSATKNVKQTKKQLTVQQDAKEVFDRLNDTIMQASSVRIRTNKAVIPGNAELDKNGNEIYRTTGFDSALTAGNTVEFMSRAAYDSIEFATEKFGGAGLAQYMNKYSTNGVGKPSTYKTNSFGKKELDCEYVSQAEYEAATEKLKLGSTFPEYAVFDDGEYGVVGISTGAVEVGSHTYYYTVLYDSAEKSIYLNKNDTGTDFDIDKKNIIATNCTEFTVCANEGKSNALALKLTLSDGGYSYTFGGTVNIRNNKVME